MQQVEIPSRWERVAWPEWVPSSVREEIILFYDPSMGRGPKDWYQASQSAPPMGALVEGRLFTLDVPVTGRYVHAWNGVGKVVDKHIHVFTVATLMCKVVGDA